MFRSQIYFHPQGLFTGLDASVMINLAIVVVFVSDPLFGFVVPLCGLCFWGFEVVSVGFRISTLYVRQFHESNLLIMFKKNKKL